MDALSEVLALLTPRSHISGGLDAGGSWSVQYPNYSGIKCYVVVEGSCWLRVRGVRKPVRIEAGNAFLLPRGSPFCLASDLNISPVPFEQHWRSRKGDVLKCNRGGEFFLLGSHFDLDERHAQILLDILPPIVRIRADAGRDVLRWSMERMRQELTERQPGASLMVQHLVGMILVQALRQYLADADTADANWLLALGDEQLSAAITAMHESPGTHWTLQKLATRAAMSRSVFAQKFADKVGTTPRAYLTRWRMLLAAKQLTSTRDSIATIAASLGYESESAFSLAFKKIMGTSPRRYELRRRAAGVGNGAGSS